MAKPNAVTEIPATCAHPYHLKDEGGPSTSSKNRLIPTESDTPKGKYVSPPLIFRPTQ